MLGKHPRSGTFRLILNQCALSYVNAESWELLELFNLYRDFKTFPFAGTVLEQPAPLIDAFKIFQVEINAVNGTDRPLTAPELIEILSAAFGKR